MKESADKMMCTEIRSLSHHIYRYVENRPNKKMLDSMTGSNGFIIGYLVAHDGEDIFQKDVEKEFGITRSTASKVLDLMEQKNMIKRVRVPWDARLKKIVLTEKSEEIAHIIHKDMYDLDNILTDGFSQEEKDTLLSLIKRMKRNLENSKEGF